MEKKKITNIEVKRKNRNDVFRYICKNAMVSNPDISENKPSDRNADYEGTDRGRFCGRKGGA